MYRLMTFRYRMTGEDGGLLVLDRKNAIVRRFAPDGREETDPDPRGPTFYTQHLTTIESLDELPAIVAKWAGLPAPDEIDAAMGATTAIEPELDEEVEPDISGILAQPLSTDDEPDDEPDEPEPVG